MGNWGVPKRQRAIPGRVFTQWPSTSSRRSGRNRRRRGSGQKCWRECWRECRGDAFLPDPSVDSGLSSVGASFDVEADPQECVAPTSGPSSGSLAAIVGNFKSVTARRINHIRKTPGVSVWQRNYYERIIRNERELHAIRQYIRDNPINWAGDRENPS